MDKRHLQMVLALLLGSSVTACGNGGTSLPAVQNMANASVPVTSAIERTAQNVAAVSSTGIDIDSGATVAVGNWQADSGSTYVGWHGTETTTNAINLSAVANPPPSAVYQTQRYSQHLTYTIPGLTAGAGYNVRMHFVESHFAGPGMRVFGARINGVQVMTNFDIFQSSGGANIGIAKQFTSAADSTGTITIQLDASVNCASIAGIEIIPIAAPSGTYYVSTTGKDTNPGTSASPFLTVQHAADVAVAGNTVIVENGSYEAKNPAGCTSTCYVLLLSNSGTASQRITFKSQNPLGASLDGNNFSTGYCVGLNANVAFVTIEGFDVTHCRYGGIMMNNPSNHDMLISQNHVHNIAEVIDKSCSGYGSQGINSSSGTYNIVLDSNTINDVGRLPGDGCGADLDYTNDHLIYMHGYNQTITNNVLYHAHSGWAIQITGYTAPDGPGWLIANNTIGPSNNAVATGDFVVYTPTGNSPSGSIENNITISPNGSFVNLYSSGSKWNLKNNLIGNGAALYTGSGAITSANNVFNVNPQLVGPSTYNYNLDAGSPIAASGLYISAISHNFNQAGRANPPSIGAF